jgi:Cu/Ag efflux protein CusF
MRTNLNRLAWLRPAPAIIFAAAALAATGLTASASATNVVYGTVQHVSTNNIKVAVAHTNNSLSFEIVPKFDQVFSSDGKATYQMKDVKPGTFVKVYYDQKALGVRHADKIYIYKSNSQFPTGTQ